MATEITTLPSREISSNLGNASSINAILNEERIVKWKKELKFKDIIPGTNILPCKVFLMNDIWKEHLNDGDKWDLMSLINSLKRQNLTISLILDLNRSFDYYDFDSFVRQYPKYNYITYKKIPVDDKAVPKKDMVEKVHEQLDEHFNKDGVIVVHCVNGRNRTGYMISSYLCKKFGISGEEAMKAFEEARGHSIQYGPLKEDLKSLYP